MATKKMKHLENALASLGEDKANYVKLHQEDGYPPVLTFIIQDKPVNYQESEDSDLYGVVGVQATDIIEYTKGLFESLNEAFPCEENDQTIRHITAALSFQEARTKDREDRGVEGKNIE